MLHSDTAFLIAFTKVGTVSSSAGLVSCEIVDCSTSTLYAENTKSSVFFVFSAKVSCLRFKSKSKLFLKLRFFLTNSEKDF